MKWVFGSLAYYFVGKISPQKDDPALKKKEHAKGEKQGAARREFLRAGAIAGVAVGLAPVMGASGIEVRNHSPAHGTDRNSARQTSGAPSVQSFELDEITIAELQDGMKSGKVTARSIAEQYLARIEAIDRNGPSIRSVIETNPDALAIAEELDQERKAQGARGPLHGIPVLIKDNIDTSDRMMTTAGSLALLRSKPLKDSYVAKKLREAGAVILGKTNPSEWANIRSSHSAGSRKILTRSIAILADRVPEPAQEFPRIWARWASEPRPTARSCAPRRRTDWWGLSLP